MEYTILILLLPLLSFLFLGLAGMKLKPVAAGLVGTAVLGVVMLLSCCTAFEYFMAGRDAAGAFPTLIPWNTVWLPISRTLHISGWEGFNAAMDYIPGFVWFFGKAFFVVWLLMWIKWTFPRLRIDQILTLEWKYLVPIGLANLLLMVVVVVFKLHF